MSPPEKIEDAAALWVVRLERGLTAAEQDEFLQWLTADARHGEELARQKANWVRLDVLADWRPEHAARPNRDLLAPPRTVKRPWLRKHAWFVPATLVAAAAAAAVWILALRPDAAEHSPLSAGSPPIAAIEQRALEDGSLIELNRGAEIAVRYTASERFIRLERGEANFQVAKNQARPFVVSAGGVDVRAVGTAFNVRRDAATVEVIVTEGKVQVQCPDHPDTDGRIAVTARALVEAGQQAIVSLAPGPPSLTVATMGAEQLDEKLAWHPRLLDFSESPLSAVVAEFNRRNAPVRITIADATLAETVVSASLRSDNVEGFIRLLEGGFGAEAERDGNTVTLRTARRN